MFIANGSYQELHCFLQRVGFLHPLHEKLVYFVDLPDSLVQRRICSVLVRAYRNEVGVVVVQRQQVSELASRLLVLGSVYLRLWISINPKKELYPRKCRQF